MTRHQRTLLFIICLILFLLTAPVVVFYSQGYRIDFRSKKISQTGALFLKVWHPKNVKVFLDDRFKKKTDFFFGSILIENLLPKKYRVRLEKEGYHPWEKDVEIKEKEVEEFKNIVLIPKNLNFTILGKEIVDFYFSPDGKKIILKEIEKGGWALKLYEPEKNVKSHLVNESSFIPGPSSLQQVKEKEISKTGADLLDLKFSLDSKKVFIEIGLNEQIKYYTLEIEKIPPLLTENKEPFLASEITFTSPQDILTYQLFDNDVYYLNKIGHLFKNGERLTEKPFSIKPETKYELNIFKEHIFLSEDKILYLFEPRLKSFEKFFEGINSLKISPDSKKIAYFSDFEIWILFLEEKFDQPQKKAGEKLFLTRFSEKIDQLFWYTSSYLIFNTANKIKIVEIDERDKINIVDLGEFKDSKIFFNQSDKKLYILSEGNLFASQKLF